MRRKILGFILAALLCAGTASAATGDDAQKSAKTAEYDSAVARKQAGKKMAIWGAAVAGTGLVVAGWTDGRCVSGDCAWNNSAYAVMATGDVVAITGLVKWFRANRDLKRLDAQRAAGKSATLGLTVGRHSAAAAYRIRWP